MKKQKTKGRGALPARVSRKRGQPRRSAKPRVLSWPARIKVARKAGTFKTQDRLDSGNWPTCACGNLDVTIPRGADGYSTKPKDERLQDLGVEFHEAVKLDDFLRARHVIAAITKRAAEVLREQRSKP